MIHMILVSLVMCGGAALKLTPPAGGKPRVLCTLPAVDCSDPDREQQAQCTVLALQGNQVVVVKSAEKPGKYLVAIWKDACR